MNARVMVSETFEAAHRLLDHPGKCRFLHGHSYQVDVSVEREVGRSGMAMDFGTMKKTLRSLTDILDHSAIFQTEDPLTQTGEEHLVLVPFPPTAECLAAMILGFMETRLDESMLVTVHETRTSQVTVREPKPGSVLWVAYTLGIQLSRDSV